MREGLVTHHLSRITPSYRRILMASQIDARGLSCPQPVIKTRSAIQNGDFPIEVLVETVTSRENVKRAAEKAGCTVQIEEMDGEFKLTLAPEAQKAV
jgi:TusA-related sulfurtransferase